MQNINNRTYRGETNLPACFGGFRAGTLASAMTTIYNKKIYTEESTSDANKY